MAKRKARPEADTPRVYSYLRFSTPEQKQGDSLRRQTEEARAFAEKHGLVFDEDLCMKDEGLSGFYGENISKGVLGQFRDAIRAGKIPRGSILFVENVDRLGRQAFIDGIEIIIQIVKAGISIHTSMPEATYTRESLNGGLLYQLVGQMELAYEESKKKSVRGKRNWVGKRQRAREGELLTKQTPAWLEFDDNGNLGDVPKAKKTIREIFNLKLKGYGVRRIVEKLNSDDSKYWIPEKIREKQKAVGWRKSYVFKILRGREVMGEFQPHRIVREEDTDGKAKRKRIPDGSPIQGYYPVMVDEDIFYAVQNLIERNKGTGGRADKVGNLFTGLTVCPYCDGKVDFIDKGRSPKSGGKQFVCNTGIRGRGCHRIHFPYEEVEGIILNNCRDLDPRAVLPDPKEKENEAEALRNHIAGLTGAIEDIKGRIDILEEQMERTKNAKHRDRFEARMEKWEKEQEEKEQERAKAVATLEKLNADSEQFKERQRDLVTLMKRLHDPEVRLRARAHLRQLIERIDVYSHGFTELYDETEMEKRRKKAPAPVIVKKGKRRRIKGRLPANTAEVEYRNSVETIMEYIYDVVQEVAPEQLGTKELKGFVDYVIERRMGRDGRFVRVTFRTGKQVDLAPDKSIADSRRLEYDPDEDKACYASTMPDLDKLWKQWRKHLSWVKGERKRKKDTKK